jgi:diguanylate cyclase (GGDEF)-like protein
VGETPPCDEGGVSSAEHVDPGGMGPAVATRVLRAVDRSPSTVVTLVDADLSISWVSESATWVTGTEPEARRGASSLERIHPDDVSRIVHGLEQLRLATAADAQAAAMPEPIRYRFRRMDGRWVVMEATIHNHLADPVVQGFLVFSRPVTGELDGVGYVLDLLGADQPLADVLAACAALVPDYLGVAAAVAFVGDGPVVGVPDASPVAAIAHEPGWWQAAMRGDAVSPTDFAGIDPALAARARAAGFRSAWQMPIEDQVDGQVIGALLVWVRLSIERTIGVEEALRHSRRLAGLAIAEERRRHALYRMAETDALTGLANRAALDRRLARSDGPVTLALIDLDHFKPVNDTYGHDTGDTVLRVVGARLRGGLRANDLAARFGGDEFAVVFTDGTSLDEAHATAGRVVEAIEAPIAARGAGTLSVGASVGVAIAPAGDVIRLADAALYEAKRAGRRCDASPPARSELEPSVDR